MQRYIILTATVYLLTYYRRAPEPVVTEGLSFVALILGSILAHIYRFSLIKKILRSSNRQIDKFKVFSITNYCQCRFSLPCFVVRRRTLRR